MEPQLPKPQFNSETLPSQRPQFQGIEESPVSRTGETAGILEKGNETREVFNDSPQGASGAPLQAFTPPPMPVVEPASALSTTLVNDTPGPTTAADDDLIEREWVEKAKKVVAENRNDPHAQDMAIGLLQADYLKKRYGKVVALPKDS